jgi:hypothetical protein
LIDRVYISYQPGSGGNFLRHFLDPDITNIDAPYWVDKTFHSVEGGGDGEPVPFDSENMVQFDYKYPEEFTIGLGPTVIEEFIKISLMSCTKNCHISIDEIDKILINIQGRSVDFFKKKVHIMIPYSKLFDYDLVKSLYKRIHNVELPEIKQKYYQSYKLKHDAVFQSWQYNVIEKIFLFEYNNNLIESVSGRMRAWSIDEINEYNWQEFLEEKLCPTNYS